jgi:alpha-pyrone synthase
VSYIAAIETALPRYSHTQEEFTDFFSNATDDVTTKRKIKIISKKTGIHTRYSVLKDYSVALGDFEFYEKNKNLEPSPSLTKRMSVYKKEAVLLSIEAIKKINHFEEIKHSITHLITVTCTGLFAPGLDIELIRALDLNAHINRSSINFMGCNAAILALKNADTICKSDHTAKVLIVCTELCTLHFQKKYNDDYLLSNMLFGDGSAAVLVTAEPDVKSHYTNIKIGSFNSLILHKGYHDMAWQLSETGFIMNLTSYVSGLIKENIQVMLDSIAIDTTKINHWAIHPGGKKIIDDFFEVLKIDPSKASESYDVLRDYGNMSSPTVLFVLKQVLENNANAKKGESIFSAAFGPGLSIETMQLSYA